MKIQKLECTVLQSHVIPHCHVIQGRFRQAAAANSSDQAERALPLPSRSLCRELRCWGSAARSREAPGREAFGAYTNTHLQTLADRPNCQLISLKEARTHTTLPPLHRYTDLLKLPHCFQHHACCQGERLPPPAAPASPAVPHLSIHDPQGAAEPQKAVLHQPATTASKDAQLSLVNATDCIHQKFSDP